MSRGIVPGGRYRHRLIEFLTKKPYRDHMRTPKSQAPRTIPMPVFGPSENSAVSANYYHQRDYRRNMGPPVSLVMTNQIAAGEGGTEAAFVAPIPGNIYNPGEKPYPHDIGVNDRQGFIRQNPRAISMFAKPDEKLI